MLPALPLLVVLARTLAPLPPDAPTPAAGTGAVHAPRYVAVTGAGPRPGASELAVAPVAACAGDGRADDTACLQRAIDAAAAAKQPLAIPATAAHYRISRPLRAITSLVGTGGMPTIRTTSSGSGFDEQGAVLLVVASKVRIENLRLVGTYAGGGTSPGAQSAGPNVSLGNVSHVTLAGNVLEGAQGDAISDHRQELDGGAGGARDVLIQGNTMRRPYRCCVSLVEVVERWAILDNVCEKEGNDSSSPFDWEPWRPESRVSEIELAWNRVTLWSGASPKSPPLHVNGWFDPTPGGGIYTHHNFGDWPENVHGGFVGASGRWERVVSHHNGRGPIPPQ